MLAKIVSVITVIVVCFIFLFTIFIAPYQKQIDSLKQDIKKIEQKIEEISADMIGTLQPDGTIYWEEK